MFDQIMSKSSKEEPREYMGTFLRTCRKIARQYIKRKRVLVTQRNQPEGGRKKNQEATAKQRLLQTNER